MAGRSSPITSPSRARNNGGNEPSLNRADEPDSLYEYSPLSSAANSPLARHKELGFYASPTSSASSRSIIDKSEDNMHGRSVSSYNRGNFDRDADAPPPYEMDYGSIGAKAEKTLASTRNQHSPLKRFESSNAQLPSQTLNKDTPPQSPNHSIQSNTSRISKESSKYSEIMKYLDQSNASGCGSATSAYSVADGRLGITSDASGHDDFRSGHDSSTSKPFPKTFLTDRDPTPTANRGRDALYRTTSAESDLPDDEKLGMSTYSYGEEEMESVADLRELSSMSLSPGKKPSRMQGQGYKDIYSGNNSTTSRTPRTYVWDEWDAKSTPNIGSQQHISKRLYTSDNADDISSRLQSVANASNSDTVTYFSVAAAPIREVNSATKSQTNMHSDASVSSGKSGSTLMTVISQVKEKVQNVSSELNQTKQKAQELHVELVRVNTARKRRLLKFKQDWEQRLTMQREEQNAATKKISEFCHKVEDDVRNLQSKIESLTKKANTMDSQRESLLVLTTDELEKRARQARKQWETEEKLVFDKILKEKVETFKKQAADSFGPTLDKLVEDGKIKVRERRAESELRLQKLAASLQVDVQNKLALAKDQFKEQLRSDDDKVRRTNERKLSAALEEQERETERLKAKYEREKQLLETSTEQALRAHAEVTLDGIRDLRHSENKQLADLLAQHQKELGQLAGRQTEALNKLQEDIQRQNEHYLKSLQEMLNKEQTDKSLQERHVAEKKIRAETEKILIRLREDAAREQDQLQKSIIGGTENLRVTTHSHLETMQASEKRSTERLASLKGEIEDFEQQIAEHENIIRMKNKELSESNSRLIDLRLDLRSAEQATEETDMQAEKEKAAVRRKHASQLAQLEEEDVAAKEALSRAEVAAANRLEDQRAAYEHKITMIRDKVAALLTSKDANAKELKIILSELQDKCSYLQDQLDVYRARQYSGVDNSTEELQEMLKKDESLLQKLNIGNVDVARGTRTTPADKTAAKSNGQEWKKK